jgi:rare lipoprotein A (peptidoglycan hydrolase)
MIATGFVYAQSKKQTSKKAKDTLDPRCEQLERIKISECRETKKTGDALKKCHEDAKLEGVEVLKPGAKKGRFTSQHCVHETEIAKTFGADCIKKCPRGIALIPKGYEKNINVEVCNDKGREGKNEVVVCREDDRRTPRDEKQKQLDNVFGKQQGKENKKGAEGRIYTPEQARRRIGQEEKGIASRYGDPGDKMAGSIVTASGAIRDDDRYHMASQHYPDGTVGIMKGPNGNEIPIVVNNSGVFYERYGRLYDLSPAAADAVGIDRNRGTGPVSFTPMYVPEYPTYAKERSDYVRGFEPSWAEYYLTRMRPPVDAR